MDGNAGRPAADMPVADVVVAGYGPVGAVLAALLGRRGLDVVVVEPVPEPYPLPRAVATDDEGLRILAGLPGMRTLPDRVNGLQRAAFVDPAGRVLVEMAFGETELGMPGVAFFHQPSLERELRAAVAGLPTVRVAAGRAVAAVEQDPDGVDVRLDDGSALRARWLVGCDGASSRVRRLLGVGYRGRSAGAPWLVVDVETDAPLPHLPYFSYVCDPRRPSVNMPMPGGHRWEWMVLPGEDAAALATAEAVRGLLRPWVDPTTVRVVRSAVYTFHARTADRWRVGRVLLAGDAAHCMPPFAGQGLAAGLRDAANLAWRLDEVVRGVAGSSLLDGYEAERRPHVEAMTRRALLAGRVLQSTSPTTAGLARGALRAVGATPGAGGWLRRGGARPRPRLPSRAAGPWPAAGRLLPNPRVRTLAGRTVRLDDLLGTSWTLLAAGHDPVAGYDDAIRDWADARGAGTLAVVPVGGLRAAAGLGCPVAEDLDGTLLRLLLRHRGGQPAVAVVRPDRYLLGLLPAPLRGADIHRGGHRPGTPGGPGCCPTGTPGDDGGSMDIGVIGSGHIGGTLARLLAGRGDAVAVSNSRGPETLGDLAADLGPDGRATTVSEAARFGHVVIVSIPFGRYRELPADALDGRIVVDSNNYYPDRDGHFPELDSDATTSSELLARHLPGARVVKAFNAIHWENLRDRGRPAGDPDRLGIPLSGDDPAAKRAVADLIDSLGFDPLDAGGLADGGRRHQVGGPAYTMGTPTAELRRLLG